MRNLLTALMVTALLATAMPAGAQAPAAARVVPDIRVIDGKVSVQADNVPLGRLLRLLDLATGMTSKVNAAELANRNISVRFSNLDFDAAIRKIFQGQTLDYVFIPGQGVIVTAASQTVSSTASSTAPFVSDSNPFMTAAPNVGGVDPLAARGAVAPAANAAPANTPAATPAAGTTAAPLFGSTAPPVYNPTPPAAMNPSPLPFPPSNLPSPSPTAQPAR